jgi:hypothetical protein
VLALELCIPNLQRLELVNYLRKERQVWFCHLILAEYRCISSA